MPQLIPKKSKEAKLKCNEKVNNGTFVAYLVPKGLLPSSSRGIASKHRFWNGRM